ncbi:cytochrome b [Aureimonas flava]|uniref:Cytochrome b n=2 Tax=Aureimonas flava TaxID=2320271 RepID=A0A3A1WIB6_9HYPH|nr:cytochrome b [Aureimonas flava]
MLHWSMALLFTWQFTTVVLSALAHDTAVERFFWGTHYSVGFTLWALVLLRAVWGLSQLKHRPPHEGSRLLQRAATLGHLALYLLMVIVPSLAILRAAGNGRGLRVYGIQLVAPGGEANPALTAPANLLHGFLGWTLFVLIAGHIAMALWHGLVRRDATLRRMTRGPERGPRSLRSV